MLGAAKAAIVAASAFLVIGLLTPLAVFIAETAADPHVLRVDIANVAADGDYVVVVVNLTYRGSIPLTNFKVKLYGEELDFGTVVRGSYAKELRVARQAITDAPSVEESFEVAGIYRVRIVSAPKGG